MKWILWCIYTYTYLFWTYRQLNSGNDLRILSIRTVAAWVIFIMTYAASIHELAEEIKEFQRKSNPRCTVAHNRLIWRWKNIQTNEIDFTNCSQQTIKWKFHLWNWKKQIRYFSEIKIAIMGKCATKQISLPSYVCVCVCDECRQLYRIYFGLFVLYIVQHINIL